MVMVARGSVIAEESQLDYVPRERDGSRRSRDPKGSFASDLLCDELHSIYLGTWTCGGTIPKARICPTWRRRG